MLDYLISPIIHFIDYNGKPLTGGRVEVYLHDISTPYVTFQDFNGTRNEFKVPLNERGECVLIASTENAYDIYVFNSFDSGSPVISRLNVHTMNYDAPSVTTPLPSVSANDTLTVVAESKRSDGGTNYGISISEAFLNRIGTIEQNISSEGSARVAADNALQGAINAKQDKLTAGKNVTISGNTISATDTTYTAGKNVTISGTTISATDTTYSAGQNITINGTTISATDTTYSAGSGIAINGTTISVDDTVATKNDVAKAKTTVTAGANITVQASTATDGHTNYQISGVESVPNVNVTSKDHSLTVTTTTAGNNKTFDLRVNGSDAEYICSTGVGVELVELSSTDRAMSFSRDYYRSGITRNGDTFSLTNGQLYHVTVQIKLKRKTAGTTVDRLWCSLFGALVYFNADSSYTDEQSIELSIDALYSGGTNTIKMGTDASGWLAYVNVLCVHRVAGVVSASGSGGDAYLLNRAGTMPTGAIQTNFSLPCPNNNTVYYGVGFMLLSTAPISLANGLKITFDYTGGQSDTGHVIALYKAVAPYSTGALELVATTTDTHNDAWGGFVSETMETRTNDEYIDPNCVYYVVYAVRGYSPIQLGGNAIVSAATFPLNCWQYNTLSGWGNGAPSTFTYVGYGFGYVPFCTITANI